MADFKVPSSVPQDLLLIQELVGIAPTVAEEKITQPPSVEDDISSSDSEAETESVKAELLNEPKNEKPQAEEVAVYVIFIRLSLFMNGFPGPNRLIRRQTNPTKTHQNRKPKPVSRKSKQSMKM